MKNFEIITHNHLQFLKADPSAPFDPGKLEKMDAIIIDYTTYHDVSNLLREIRSHNEKEVYLTPCFLHNLAGNMDESLIRLTDGVITNLSNLDALAVVVRKIQSRMK